MFLSASFFNDCFQLLGCFVINPLFATLITNGSRNVTNHNQILAKVSRKRCKTRLLIAITYRAA